MNTPFKRIAIICRTDKPETRETVQALYAFLKQHQQPIVLERETAHFAHLQTEQTAIIDKNELAQHSDLAVVIGGDGSLLQAARTLVPLQLPVLGINRGRLGFLTDILPQDFEAILPILAGQYQREERALLHVTIEQFDKKIEEAVALNDVVLLAGDVAHMIEFEIFINQKFLCSQRADGLIIATPTGSTAYALSAGGPILQPDLQAIVLVPMFAHTLTSRPIVLDSSREIRLHLMEDEISSPGISCDGQTRIPIDQHSIITITQNKQPLSLIHPVHYNYYETLRSKLHWGQRLT